MAMVQDAGCVVWDGVGRSAQALGKDGTTRELMAVEIEAIMRSLAANWRAAVEGSAGSGVAWLGADRTR